MGIFDQNPLSNPHSYYCTQDQISSLKRKVDALEDRLKKFLSVKPVKFDVSQQDYNNPSLNHENMMAFYDRFAAFLEENGVDKLAGLPPKLLASYLYDQSVLVSTLRKHTTNEQVTINR